jgi:hypothetical protein
MPSFAERQKRGETLVKLLYLLAGALALASVPANAAVTKAAADAQCKPGMDKPASPEGKWSGGLRADVANLTPYAVPGAKHVTRYEADCLLIAYDWKLRFVTPMNDRYLIPFTMKVPYGGNGPGEELPQVAARLKEITGGDLDYPLVAYCHNPSCYLSYNLVLRAAKLGYRNLYWLRDGIAAYPTTTIQGEYSAADDERHMKKYRGEMFFCRSFYRAAFGKEGEPLAALIESGFSYPGKGGLVKVGADNDAEVANKLSEARARDAAAKKAGFKSYEEENYIGEQRDICHGMMRGVGVIQ